MAESTGIAWTTSSWSPWIGCTEVSPGCDNCYARELDKRRRYDGAVHWGAGVPRYRTKSWGQPLAWNKKAALTGERWTVFPSLCDPFDNEVPERWRDEFFALISITPNLVWLLLTKRIGNAAKYLADPETPRRVDTMRHVMLAGRLEELHAPERTAEITAWPGYFITSKGRVLSDRTKAGTRSTERHEIKPQPGDAGHQRVMLQVNGNDTRELVHRLVLTAFDRIPLDGEQGCHIDGDPSNNALWNLRWGTQGDNWCDSKRHGTRRRYSKLTQEQAIEIKERHAAGESAAALGREFGVSDTQVRNISRGLQWTPEQKIEWPLPIWLGASVVNQEETDRDIPKLLATPAAKRFVSYEPALGPVDFEPYLDGCCGYPDTISRETGAERCCGDRSPVVDWLIVGGESSQGGAKARPFDLVWARSTVAQCRESGTACFVKQLGSNAFVTRGGQIPYRTKDRAGADPSEWPSDLMVQQVPEEQANG